jgi:uncharacterized protein
VPGRRCYVACYRHSAAVGAQVAAIATTSAIGSPAGTLGWVRITIWVRPGSARTGVGGEHDGALVVRVSARAVDGKATAAALTAVAEAFGVRQQAVTLVSGATSRMKIIDVAGADGAALDRLLTL